MKALEADAEQEEGDGKLGADHGEAVEKITEKPAVSSSLNLCISQIDMVPACSVLYANVGRHVVQEKEELIEVSKLARMRLIGHLPKRNP